MDGDYGEDDFYEYPDDLGLSMEPPNNNSGNNFGNRYKNAYGSYAGGYGPMGGGRGGFGPPGNFGPPLGFGPPPMSFSGPRGPGLWARGPPHPPRPQKNEAVKYLIKCGVPREHLRNLPRDLLQLITPDYCGLCAVEFDTFALSRLHYSSKNHLKNQKKWQMNQGQMGNAHRMTPMKSRDLYCELCDVQITSKVHSESHYAGRSHKAVVEGRRKPKNPILLQPGMEERVKQLVRREKKFIVDVEPTTPATTDEKTKDKQLPPELYCDICKTFVTCSEQMTLHLNGKRHLNKEKQYILRMMKGEQSDNKSKSKEETLENTEDDLLMSLDAELVKLPPIEDKEDRKDNEENDDEEVPSEVKDTGDAQATGEAAVAYAWENNGENWDEPETLN